MKNKSEKMDALIKKNKGIFMSFLKERGIALKSRYKGKIEGLPIKGKVIAINWYDMTIEVLTDTEHIITVPPEAI